MQLKTLEIKGFKSFAEKTIINFNQEITGVVGPNGCGKSNIVDAIRWVLGEQKSKELRSEKMSNVIFNGTKKRKAGGKAEVSLTFENTKNILPTDYHTVTITRMLYRSGESEYRLNNIPCRLKDITSLFLDTGIGSDSYAIIALNMVDDLLNDREHSRRRLFEQAAGISKYKKRKRETLNKLKGTEADLDRVEDLLFEIENNLKSLEKQAKRAKKYFELKEKYKELSVELAIHRIGEFKTAYKGIKGQIEQEENKKVELQTNIQKLEASLEKQKKDNLEMEKALSDRQKTLNSLIGKIRSKENDKKVMAQKVIFIQQNQTNLFDQIELAKENQKQTEKDIIHYKDEITNEKIIEEQLEAQLEEANKVLTAIRENHGVMKSELEEFIQEQQQQERKIFELEKQLAINQTQKENLKLEVQKNNQDIADRSEEVKTLKSRLDAQEDVRVQKKELVEQLYEKEVLRKQDIEIATQDFEKLEQQIVGLNRKLDAKRNEFKLTKSLVDNLEGFPESIKFLSKNKKWTANAPLLSDIIFCSEEYRIAIENYLDSYLNYYVVQNQGEAMQAISLLSQSQKGKANFFLLDELKKSAPLSMKLQPSGATTTAIDVVQTEESYLPLINYLLGNVWITESDDPAQQPETSEGMVLLSKSGNYAKSKFTLSGGSVGLFEGKRIGRKKNLEVLTRAINDLEKEGKRYFEQYEKLRKKIKDLKKAEQSELIRVETESLNSMHREAVSLQTKLENYESFLKDIQGKHNTAENRILEIEKQDLVIQKELEVNKQLDNRIKERVARMDDSYRAVAEELSNASTDYNQRNIEFIRQQNRIQALQRELSFRERQLADIKSKITADTLSREHEEKNLKETHEKIKLYEEELIRFYEEKTAYEATLNSAEQDYYSSRGKVNELDDENRKLQRRHQDTQGLIASLKDKFNEIKIELSSIGERLRIEFNVEVNELIKRDANPELQRAELEEKVERIKRRLDNYGEINPMAVEAYDEMNERFQFITGQRDDLLNAKESLLETIGEIEETATKHFIDAFEKVRTNFKKVFRSLFTEDDDCDLTLSDPDNPLDSSIKIMAKPKGKRPQTINQLSGGEKTLTATALLFSLYLLKPAPFCIFDEVDAPLDDANIGKFNKIIKKFSADSQFIIVTHNKTTMAAVDVIYGVTMAEQGVSRVVNVDFRNLN
ncbi:MAG: chromosome segregation protein SMC [Bacteroidota bacterium]